MPRRRPISPNARYLSFYLFFYVYFFLDNCAPSTAKYRTTGAEALVLQEVVTPALVQAMADASRAVAVSAAQVLALLA